MAVPFPLSIRPKEERRAEIRFLFMENKKPMEIIRRLQAHYGCCLVFLEGKEGKLPEHDILDFQMYACRWT
ncbi:hypothetical protein TNCV_3033991 [Trichonephila clavipes]|nr:hypothetical protein TNCV_3033991 [Trichonephila clavipes]